MELLQKLEHPEKEYTPIPFWFLNGDLSEEELQRQLEDFAVHGVYGVVLHPRMGLPARIKYLEESFFYYIRVIVKKAAELGMKVVLYDEGMYPSGSACGKVVEGHPEFASEGIGLVKAQQPGDEILAQFEDGVLVARKSGGTLRGIHWGEDDGEPFAPFSADILNPDAVERFISLTHEAYYKELKQYFGNTIIGFFTDEPSILGRNSEQGQLPWTHNFAEEFTKGGGTLKNLAAMFRGEKNKDTELYERMILRKESENYYGKLSAWCEKHSIALMGHPHQSDDIEVQKYFHVPGQDLVLRWIAPETGGVAGMDSTMGKCSADAARLMGRRRNSNECFGACNKNNNPWQLSGGDVKWYLDWLAVRGVNMFIPHAYYYSIEGRRKDERPPDVGPNSIWWNYYEKWATYMKRLAFMMTDCKLYASAAVLCHNRDLKVEEVRPLFENQIGFQYLPESVWKDCRIDERGFWYKEQCYQTVVGDVSKFPEAKHMGLNKAVPDCVCIPSMPELRVMHFEKSGTECWFLVNEANEPLKTELILPTEKLIGTYDLWTGKAVKSGAEKDEKGRRFLLEIPIRGSMLLFACSKEEYEFLPECVLDILEINPQFILVQEDEDKVQKTYHAVLNLSEEDLSHNEIRICLEAEEMAELMINGKAAGAEFWSPQVFEVKQFLQLGKNELDVTVTGSLANIYGNQYVWYGMKEGEMR